jgi:CMP-N-acetylneuraminic acid synthetase
VSLSIYPEWSSPLAGSLYIGEAAQPIAQYLRQNNKSITTVARYDEEAYARFKEEEQDTMSLSTTI